MELAIVYSGGSGRFNLRGQQKPRFLVDAAIASDKAWKDYERMCDTHATNEQLDRSRDYAKHLEHRYHEAYAEWQANCE
jgi:hypothetical protein